MVQETSLAPLVWFIPSRVDGGGQRRQGAAPVQPAYRVIPAMVMDSGKVGRLMKAAADATKPGSRGMRAVSGVAAGDNERALVRIVLHEAAHAVIAERWGFDSKIDIGRGARFGTGLCQIPSLLPQLSTPDVRRQIGFGRNDR